MGRYHSLTDPELLNLLAMSNEYAFREIYDRHWKAVLNRASGKLDNLQEAEDLVNELFVSLWKRRKSMPKIESLQNYFQGAVRNQVLKIWGRRRHAERYVSEQLHSAPASEHFNPNALEYKELKVQINKAIAELPEKCRTVFELSRDQGLSQKQISDKLGISLKTVEAHINKALKTLKIKLGDYLMNFFF